MLCKLHRPFTSIALLGVMVLGSAYIHSVAISASPSVFRSQCELVVLASLDDPYYPLAKEIAGSENAPIAHSLPDAIACHPVFLLWVVSSTSLSDAVMIEFGQTMHEQSSAISSGIITASTLEQARDLWKRRTQVRGHRLYAANAPNPSAHIYEGELIAFGQGQSTTYPLTKTSFVNALRSADYLTFTGHGGSRYLRLNESTKIIPADIPSLNATVVGTGSCQTFRLWNEDSIARGFADQGAAAYSGFVYSPNEGYLIGEFDGLPFRYTWPEFPIGHVIQVQNRGTLQGFAQFPYQHLLGDPRTALQTGPPYQLVGDRQEGQRRILTLLDVPPGVIPIRISGGAAYHFVEVLGITVAAEEDPFYNSRLQMVNIQDDKLILLVHEGGELTLRLHRQVPWHWFPGDLLLDSLDHTFIFSQQASGDIVAMGFAVVPLVWTGWQLARKRLSWQKILLSAVIGVGASTLQGVYVLVRLDQVTVTSKTVVFSPLSIAAAFVLSTCGALAYTQSRSLLGKVTALFVMTFVSWMPMVFGLALVAAFNTLIFLPETGVELYNYSLGLLSTGSFLFTFTLSGLMLGLIGRLLERFSS